MKLKTELIQDNLLWHYFTVKSEAEQASINGYVLETSPGRVWRCPVERMPQK